MRRPCAYCSRTTGHREGRDPACAPGWGCSRRAHAVERAYPLRITRGRRTLTVAEWCARTGVPTPVAQVRIAKGWDPVVAVTHPANTRGGDRKSARFARRPA